LANIEPRQDLLRCRPPVKRFGENRAFLRLAGRYRQPFGPFRGKSESSAGNLKNPQNFQISSRCFIFLAEDLDFQLENLFSSRFFNFPAEF